MKTPPEPRTDAPVDAALTDAELHALVDEQVHGADRDRLLERLRHDASARQRLADWQAQRQALRELHRGLLDEPVPAALGEAARRLTDARARLAHWQRWGGLAAGVLLAFGTGWLARGQWPDTPPPHHSSNALPAFAHAATLAHAVYAPEQRHPVEVSASEQAHLVQWLSRRTGKALKVPDLRPLGYELVGGRLLPGDAGARAQFMFQDAQGQRITLYLGALDAGDASKTREETAFRFTGEGPVPGFYWVDQGFGYALSGPLAREALMALAETVYRQLRAAGM